MAKDSSPPKTEKLTEAWAQYFWDGRYPASRFLTGMKVETMPDAPPCRDSLKGTPEKYFLPVDPYKGETIMTFKDEGNVRVSLRGGKKIFLPKSPNRFYDSFYVSSNGFVTFGSDPKDRDFIPILPAHWQDVRMSVLFTDLFPRNGGKVTWQQLEDKVVVSWVDVPMFFEIPGAPRNMFQVIFYDSGKVDFAWASVSASIAIVGESYGHPARRFGKETGEFGGIRELEWCRPQDQWETPSSPPPDGGGKGDNKGGKDNKGK
eukprot:jgi/Mesvir1/342/Mv22746-RA.1